MFTVPRAGVWRVSFSMTSSVYKGQRNYAWLYLNGQEMEQTFHYTYSENGDMEYTGGREVMVRAQHGDTLHLGTTAMDGYFWYITSCFEFLHF